MNAEFHLYRRNMLYLWNEGYEEASTDSIQSLSTKSLTQTKEEELPPPSPYIGVPAKTPTRQFPLPIAYGWRPKKSPTSG